MSKKRIILRKYLAEEIRIDFKACLYFFCMVFFYSVFRIMHGSWEASIIHMAEMIASNYIMGYVQVYLLDNFDEADAFKGKEFLKTLMCSIIYAVVSWVCGWFDRSIAVTLIYLGYMVICFICTYLSYKVKRNIDSKLLMDDLRKYKEGNGIHVESN
jgi:hypothetical protein